MRDKALRRHCSHDPERRKVDRSAERRRPDQPGTIGRLSQVIDRRIYTACLCFGLDLAEQGRDKVSAT